MATFNDLVKKAYDIYGSSMGIKSVLLPTAKNVNQFITLKDFHFFLKDEPLPPDTWKERQALKDQGKAHHAIPFREGFYDYTVGKQYATLEEWYEDIKQSYYGENAPKMEDVLLYGKRMGSRYNHLSYELTYGDMVEKLTELTSVKTYDTQLDSWDELVKSFPERVNPRGLKIYYKDPELNVLVRTSLFAAKLRYNWDPSKPKYVVAVQNKTAPDAPVVREADTVSAIHPSLSLEDIYLETYKKFDGYTLQHRVLVSLADILDIKSINP
jgi:hypothetical protein